jgi:TM2 domain-containing membrane protein YozV
MKSKTTATVLCFFLGVFGIHRFYLGQTGLGILYLIFCWTFVPALIALIDFIGFLLMSEETFNQKYNLTSIIMKTQQTPPNNNVNTVAINMGGQNAESVKSSSDEIKRLYELKEKGIITQEEFDLKKKTIL